ncbi:MazG-like family protein [Orenia marismortui]|uniref:MazG-like nucleotide pyrophosphohydrolase family protein n=1 Tax=Orenia marismortui TaxID=46469 RepID=A0A4R8H8W7_9FIRM|nr:MazG-like family protein [Orenia marismortui]TDX51797.1 MazG-like nucleotide pyrophosphohydrolase family protein [Orenia marismortui]
MKKFKAIEGSITKNLKIIEWLKSELLANISLLFRVMIKQNETKLLEILTNIIMSTYLLAKRLGYSFDQLDRKLEKQIEVNINNKHQIEAWYGDLSELLEHLKDRN